MSTRSLRQTAQQKRKRSRAQQRNIIVGIVIAAVAVTGALIALTLLQTGGQRANTEGLDQMLDQSGAVGMVVGEADAPVTLTEYSDFSCTHCHAIVPTIHRLIEEYVRAGDVRLVYKPITFVSPPYSGEAAKAAVCAGAQGKFLEMHDSLWGMYEIGGPSAYSKTQLAAQARDLSLDVDQFNQCYASRDTAQAIEQVLAEAESMGVNGTPTLFVNGQQVPYNGADALYADLKQAIDTALSN